MELSLATWAILLIITLALNLWIVGIQGFDMNESAVQRCGDKGGACEEFLMRTDYDIFGIIPSILSFGALCAVLLLFFLDLRLGFLEIFLLAILTLGSVYFLGLQVVLRRFCSICNLYHASVLALAMMTARLAWIGPLHISVLDLIVFGVGFLGIVAMLSFAARLSESVAEQTQLAELYKNCLQLQGYKTLVALQTGQPCTFPPKSLIELSPNSQEGLPEAILAISIGCHHCANVLDWTLKNFVEITQYWNIRIVFVDTVKSYFPNHAAIALINSSCDALAPSARLSFLQSDVLPFLHGQHSEVGRLDKLFNNTTAVPQGLVPVVPFAPAICVNGTFLHEDVNFPESILLIPMADVSEINRKRN